MLQVPNLVKSDLVFNERLTEFSVDIYKCQISAINWYVFRKERTIYMKKLHKQNLIITWCSILALSMVSVLGFGLSVMALKGSIVVIVCGIISTICY